MRFFVILSLLLTVPSLLRAEEVGVLVRFGLTDRAPTVWDGSVSVSAGKADMVTGWRFQMKDEVDGLSWKASTRPLTIRRSNAQKKGAQGAKNKAAGEEMGDNGIILRLTDVSDDAVVTLKLAKGEVTFRLGEIPYDHVLAKLGGALEIERVASTDKITETRADDDYPAIAVAADGTVYTAYSSFTPGLDRDQRAKAMTSAPADFGYLAKVPGGDRLMLSIKGKDKALTVPVTPDGCDIYKSAVALDGAGRLWIFWSENKAWKQMKSMPNFEVWACSYADGAFTAPVNLSQNEANDISPVATIDAKGQVWVAWQGVRDGVFRVLARRQSGSSWSSEMRVSTQNGSCWTPAIAASKDGKVSIAWDTYDKGDYDVWLRTYATTGEPTPARPVSNSWLYEARPTLAYDGQDHLWVCWEQSGATWGKDWGAYDNKDGIGLYKGRQIGLRVLADDKWMEPVAPPTNAFVNSKPRAKGKNLPVRTPEPVDRTKGEEAEVDESANAYNNLGRIVADNDGRIWLLSRSRQNNFHTPLGTVWLNHAIYFDGKAWVGPILLPHSDNLLYNTPAVSAHPEGGIIVAHSSDHRQSAHVQKLGAGSESNLNAEKDPFDNDVYLSRLELHGAAVVPQLKAARATLKDDPQPSDETIKEREEITRVRAYRSNATGPQLQIIRGEFHRHTEISGDGGSDGPLEDMWRYAIDVAGMDWLGCGDHDNGGGREYPWWLTQKTTDAFRIAGKFEPPFTYERSVTYPEGHRNVVFEQRGVRTLPRLPKSARDFTGHAPDTQMLYGYLKAFDGVCASHTSATSMGTDWRDWNPQFEPMVEIYQGARQNYERPGAPRCPTADDSIGGWEPLGFINLAFKKGYRFSFQSSSDHGSTHISYALVYAENNSREALLKAMRLRHTYAATDNIVAEYTSSVAGKNYMMGDEFTTSESPTLKLHLQGTAPFARVVLVKDDVEVKVWEPGNAEVNLTWTDPSPVAGKTSYYYFRGEQQKQPRDSFGELVWASPMWITYAPAAK
jgi:hypothetical protein